MQGRVWCSGDQMIYCLPLAGNHQGMPCTIGQSQLNPQKGENRVQPTCVLCSSTTSDSSSQQGEAQGCNPSTDA